MDEIRQDKEITVISKEVEPIQEKIEKLVVNDEHSSKLATDYGAFISKAIKRLEERRQFFVKPLNEHVSNINAEFKALIGPLETLKELLKGKLLSYRKIVEEKAVKEQEKLNAMAKQNGLPEIEKPIIDNAVKSSIGQSFKVKRWAWKIVDMNKVPREYFSLDEKKINTLLRAHTITIKGVSSMDLKIEGIEFYQEEDISFKT